jgi:hypothetical protein
MPTVEVADEAGVQVLRLPPRDLGRIAALGGCCLLAAALFAGIIYAIEGWVRPQPQAIEFSDFEIPAVVAVVGLVFLGIALAGSRTEVRIENGRIYITESIGRFRRTLECPIEKVRRLAVRHMIILARTEKAPPPKPDDRAVLIIECDDHPEVPFAHGYRRYQLLELAGQIAELSKNARLEEPRAVEIVEQDEATLFEERETRPPGSGVSCETHADGVTLLVPPESFTKITGQALLMSLPVTILTLVRLWQVAVAWPNVLAIEWIMAGMGILALAAIWLFARARGRRRSVLAVVGDQLLVINAGVFRSKRHGWERSELYDVRSGTPANGAKGHVFELQIWKLDGSKEALLRGRGDAELRWMATMLRRALHLPAKAEPVAQPALIN